MIYSNDCRRMPPIDVMGYGLQVLRRSRFGDRGWVRAGPTSINQSVLVIYAPSFAFFPPPPDSARGGVFRLECMSGGEPARRSVGAILPITAQRLEDGGAIAGGQGGARRRGVWGDVHSKFFTPETFPTSPWDHQPSYLYFRSRSPPAWTGAKQHGEPVEIELVE